MQVKTQGLIIREQTVGESDRLVTVLTRDAGVVRAFARRAKNLKDSKSAATQLLCYSRRADRGLFRAAAGHRRAFAGTVFLRAGVLNGAGGYRLRRISAAHLELPAFFIKGHKARTVIAVRNGAAYAFVGGLYAESCRVRELRRV